MAWTDNFKRYDTSKGYGNARQWRNTFYERITGDEAKVILASQEETPYSLLGILESASQPEIRKAYTNKMKEWFPDFNMHREKEATEMCKKLNAAYSLLYKK